MCPLGIQTMRDLIGRTLGHYRIVEKVGEGGMGEVYRARDERLDRDVAIKVMPEEVASDAERLRRFEREAKAVAALSHSNILEIFDFGTEGDVTFSVTELLEGETLRERLQQEGGSLPWRRVQEIAAAIADGLGSAHGKSVVHRKRCLALLQLPDVHIASVCSSRASRTTSHRHQRMAVGRPSPWE